jgi:TonB-linked SusC/RagA family outer membrane protein
MIQDLLTDPMKKMRYLFLIFALFPLSSFAQQISINGKVTDAADGSPLPGVTVAVISPDGEKPLTATNSDGAFSVTVPANSTDLVFTSLGMENLTEKISGRTVINVSMKAGEGSALNEIVVVGYGTATKQTLTGAVSSIRAQEIQTATVTSLAQKLQGKIAGLNIRQQSGQPGQFDNAIQVRGFGNPMYVIDGIIRNDPGAFQRINPQDIESISVLKDASAAIYGIGAANGVVIVTTKQGVKGKTSFSYNVVTGISQPTNRVKAATSKEYVTMLNEAGLYSNPGRIAAPAFSKEEYDKWQQGTLPGYEGTDWWDVVMKDFSTQTQHNLSATGGSDKITYYLGMEYLKDNGLLRSNDLGYQRVNFRSNVTAQLTNSLRARVNIAGLLDKGYQPGESFTLIARNTIVTLPTQYPYANNNPQYPGLTSLGITPFAASEKDLTGYNEDESRNLQTSMELKFDVPFVKNLSLTGTGSYDMNNYLNKNLRKGFYAYTFDSATETYRPQFQRPDQNIFNRSDVNNVYMLRLAADYNFSIGTKHDIKAMLVAEQYKGWGRSLNGRRYYGDFFTNDQIRFGNEANQTVYGDENENSRISYIGRLNYDYARKYLLDFAFNYNGSYRYHPDNRFGFFPTVSAAWRISEEGFIKNNVPAVSDLKLRASYGVLGTDAGNAFQYIPGFTFGGNSFWEFVNGSQSNGLAAPALANNFLTWSTNHTADIGIDVSFWNGKLDITADVYNRERKGLLGTRAVSLPNTFGTDIAQENLNSDRQTGFELTVGHRNNINGFNYGITGNMNYARTMSRYTERAPFQSQYDRWLNDNTDRWMNRQTGYQTAGQFSSFDQINNAPLQGPFYSVRELPGDYQFQDINNDGIINADDSRVPYARGSSPLLNFGTTISLGYKNFDLNILFQGAAGYTVRYTETLAEWFWFSGSTPGYFMDRWHQADPYNPDSPWIAGEWPAPRPNGTQTMQLQSESNLWRRNASYVRLKNVELGYTFKAALLQKIGIKNARVYTNGFNLITWTADPLIKFMDPEKTSGQLMSNGEFATTGGNSYPLTKNFNVGVSLGF